MIVIDQQISYIGLCDDLYEKFHFQFGHIQPRDCFWGGHPEQCRINHLIFRAAQEGKEINLVHSDSSANESMVIKFIRDLKPKWNIHGKRGQRKNYQHPNTAEGTTDEAESVNQPFIGPGKRYRHLTEYLKDIQGDEIVLRYEEMEQINGRQLPPSAYKYSAWWANGDRPQALSWLASGWRVKQVDLGKSVVFRRIGR